MTTSLPHDPARPASPTMSEGPRAEVRQTYTQRLEARRQTADAAWQTVRTLGTARIVVFVIFVAMAWMVTERHAFAAAWLWAPIGLFVWLVLRHRAAVDVHERALRAAAFYDEGLRRLDDTWSGRGVSGDGFRDPHHPYTSDLDVFGAGSLFQLICQTRTAIGESRLATWLRAPAPLDVVRARQVAVAELRERLDLREDLAVVTGERAVIDHAALVAWGERPVTLTSVAMRVAVFVLGAATFTAFAAWSIGYDPRPMLALIVIGQLAVSPIRGEVGRVIGGVDRPRRDLELLARFLGRLERESFQSPLLVELHGRLAGKPSERIRSLFTRMEWAEAWRNLFFALFAILLLWREQFAYAIESWRRHDGSRVGEWLDTLAELEALLSLSTYAYENPDDVFPETVGEEPCFEGVGIAHPLLPAAKAVRNDVCLDGALQLLLVSGSNMAGKSSLLRTVGTNTVLGLAGAPVRARSLRLSLLSVGACMRISDSLQAGVSHFYAEITRLRQIVDMAGDEARPLLFLLDEILHGTNSYDRRIGAEAVVRTLVSKGAIGLVTTHDLALTQIVETLQSRAINVHFQDEMVEGKMSFDYTLRPGVVEKSNAIALMRAVGLDV